MKKINLIDVENLTIGFNNRKDTYSGKLAFLSYSNNAKSLINEIAFNRWIDKKIPLLKLKNVSTNGFVLAKSNLHHLYQKTIGFIRVYHPEGFDFEIPLDNFYYLMQYTLIDRGQISGDCKIYFAEDGKPWILNSEAIKSDEFKNGEYKYKTITIHSKMRGSESEENMKYLLEVENVDNPIEIVIHVNMLKEGWDVNNLYTIVPLRTATSKILREQMIGRGLRLPYGERTGNEEIDSVMLTAHDKFEEILVEAQKGDSIFKAGNIIRVEEIERERRAETQLSFNPNEDGRVENAFKDTNLEKTDGNKIIFTKASDYIKESISEHFFNTSATSKKNEDLDVKNIASKVQDKIKSEVDLGVIYNNNINIFNDWIVKETEKTYQVIVNKFIPIPKIKITDNGVEEYCFLDFDVDLHDFNHVPIQNDLLIQNLEDMSDRKRIKGIMIDFEGYSPKKIILEELIKKPEVDYEKNSDLLFKLIYQVTDFYEKNYGNNGMYNIVMMYKKDIANRIYSQMMQHFYCKNGLFTEIP